MLDRQTDKPRHTDSNTKSSSYLDSVFGVHGQLPSVGVHEAQISHFFFHSSPTYVSDHHSPCKPTSNKHPLKTERWARGIAYLVEHSLSMSSNPPALTTLDMAVYT